jgi:hypothetical protein
MAELIYNLPKFGNDSLDLCVFYNRIEPLYFELPVSVLGGSNLSKFNGTLITTSLETSLIAKNTYFTKKPFYYYCYNLEWTYNPKIIDVARSIIIDERINIICRSLDHKIKIFEDFEKEAVFIENTCHLGRIIENVEKIQCGKVN